MKPHKHAELIKAWADGAEVEYRLDDGVKGWSEWKSLGHDRPFLSDSWWEYRLKPQRKPDVIKRYNVSLQKGFTYVDTDNQLYYPANLILLFDGETGNLEKAEII